MQYRILTALLLLCAPAVYAQDTLPAPAGQDDELIIFVDSVLTKGGMANIRPDQIAIVNVVKSARLEALYGARAVRGVMFIETKDFARRRYNRLFSELSPGYAAALARYGSDEEFQYIIDGSPLTQSVEQMLAALERKDIAGVVVITPRELKKKYKIKGKRVGVEIRTGKGE